MNKAVPLYWRLLGTVIISSLLTSIIMYSITQPRQCIDTMDAVTKTRWQFPSHRNPLLQTFYQPQQQFFYESPAVIDSVGEKREVAQCYIDHCTEEGSRRSGNYENHTTSRQKGCSNYDYQDIAVFQAFFLEPLFYGGVFVEIGAMTGWGASNTLFFERCLNWTGALFDISRDNYAQILKNRASPTTHKILGSVCEPPVQKLAVPKTAAGCCGKVLDTGVTVKEVAESSSPDGDVDWVPCKPMSQWLREVGITRIDYFSLDTEGYEYDVLRTIDWSYNNIHVLSVEMLGQELVSTKEYENQQRIRELLGRVGLTYVPWLSFTRGAPNNDEFWVNFSWTF